MRFPGPGGWCAVDGRKVDLSSPQVAFADPALLAGVGLYETLAIRDRSVFELEAHLERLHSGAGRLHIELPDRSWLRGEILAAAARLAGEGPGWVKLVVTGGGRTAVLADRIGLEEETRPASAVLLPWRRNLHDPLTGIKALGSANWLGRQEASRRGADEGLWLNTRGHLAEGSSSNLFVVRSGRLRTAGEREGILPGVVRAIVLRAAAAAGIPVHVGKLRVEKLERASEAFLTSSVRGVRPLVRYEGRSVGGGAVGPLTKKLMEEVARLREREAEASEHGGLASAPRGGVEGRRPL